MTPARETKPDVRDRRDMPTYGLSEAAGALALPSSTVRSWIVDYPYVRSGTPRRTRPLIVPARREPLTLSFWNLAEIYVLATIRRRHAISMPNVRKAIEFVQKDLHLSRPLIDQEFLTDGVHLFVERYATLLNVSKHGQRAMEDVLAKSLKRVARDGEGLALRLYPWLNEPDEPQALEINPARASGRLTIAGTAVPVEAIAQRFRAGEAVEGLADDYGVTTVQIQAALRWEQCALAA